jgi:hypothetical protein
VRFALGRRQRRFSCFVYAMPMLLLLCSGASTALPRPPADPTAAQKPQDYALIVGTVWGPDNRPVAGIPIKIRRAADKKAKWELTSDSRGEFAQRVPPGTQDYVIQADIKTPKGQPKPEITVRIDDNERKDVGLHLAELPPKK